MSELISIAATDDGPEPRLVGTDMSIGAIVTACHSVPIDDALDALTCPGLDRATLEPLLTYCAEQRCVAAAATCPGCSKRVAAKGLTSLDAFVASHREITAGAGADAVRLQGHGTTVLQVASFAVLVASWKGEDLWFWARRNIRKLRHGIRSRVAPDAARAAELGTTPVARAAKPAVILVEPQLAENIGMVARAMANFGLEELRLVSPRDGWPSERSRIAASGATFIIDDAAHHPTFASALGDLNWVCATTARQRDLAKPVLTPEQAVAELIRRIGEGQRCGIVFGRERNGLETSEIANADAVVMAPVDPQFASLNLAQSVLLLAYEWIKQTNGGTLGRVTNYESPVESGLRTRGALPATKEQVMGFFEHLEMELDQMGFLRPPEKRPAIVQNIRTMFSRMQATEQEIRTLRGIVKALVHGKGPARRLP